MSFNKQAATNEEYNIIHSTKSCLKSVSDPSIKLAALTNKSVKIIGARKGRLLLKSTVIEVVQLFDDR